MGFNEMETTGDVDQSSFSGVVAKRNQLKWDQDTKADEQGVQTTLWKSLTVKGVSEERSRLKVKSTKLKTGDLLGILGLLYAQKTKQKLQQQLLAYLI